MKKLSFILQALVGLVVLSLSCKVPSITKIDTALSLPTRYINATDTNTTPSLDPTIFFNDKVLIALIDSAIVHNPDLSIALQKVLSANAYLKMNRGLTKPSLDAVVSTGVDKFGDYTMNGLGNYDMNLSPNINKDQIIPLNMPDFFLGFRSQWEIDIWGKLSDRKKAALAQYLAAKEGRLWLKTQLVAVVAGLYYELLALDKEFEIVQRNIQLQENALDIVKALKAGGRATELAVQQFNAQLLSTKTILLRVQLQIVAIENQFNALSGYYSRAIPRGKPITELGFPTQLKPGIPANLLTRRPDIQEAALLLEATGANVQATRKAFYPSLNLSGYLALNSFNPNFLFSPQSLAYGILGGFVTPILSKNILQANFEMANAEQQAAFEEYKKRTLIACSEVNTELKKIEANNAVYDLKLKETASLQAAVTASKELFVTGYASYLEVITAQRGVLETELETIATKRAILTSYADLYRQLGGGWK